MARRLQWEVQVFGERCSETWEISVVHVDNLYGKRSWGGFDDKKLLISHNGGPCNWPLKGFVFDQQVALAHEVAHRLNSGESLD